MTDGPRDASQLTEGPAAAPTGPRDDAPAPASALDAPDAPDAADPASAATLPSSSPPGPRPSLRSALTAIIHLPGALGRLFIGPIFQREVIGAGRRRGPYILRFLYAAILLLVVSLAFAAAWGALSAGASSVAMAQSLQQVAPAITFTIGWFMLMAMSLVGPALTGGAIADEKRARTLSALMTTPLSSLEIIVGKLSARTVQIMILALLAAPLLLAMRLFGGVPAMAVAGTMAVALSLAVLGAALGIMFSIWHRAGTSAMGFAILTLGLVSFGPILLWGVVTRFNAIPPDLVLSTSALFAMMALQDVDPGFGSAVPVTLGRATVHIPAWVFNMAYHLLMTVIAVAIASGGLRRVMLAEASGGAGGAAAETLGLVRRHRRKAVLVATGAILLLSIGVGLFAAGGSLAAGVAAGAGAAIALLVVWGAGWLLWRRISAARRLSERRVQKTRSARASSRRSREVGDSPVLWRELRQSSFGSRRKLVVSMLAAYGIPVFLWIRFGPAETSIHGVIAMVCLLGAMLQAAVMTTSAVGAERESGSWDTLLATPLGAWQILGGKLAGALRRQWLLLSVVALDLGLAALGGWTPWSLLLQTIIIFAGPIVLLSAGGVLMSMLFRKPTVAAVWNLSWAIALWIGTWIAIGLLSWVTAPADEPVETLIVANYLISPVAMLGTALDAGLSEWNRGEYYIGTWDSLSAGLFTFTAFIASSAQILAGLGLVAIAAARFNRLTGRPS